ncbi:MAG: response regulator [Selenomonadaceae bacterium]|nr:response regulator [Selenomonadaceae bacterium]
MRQKKILVVDDDEMNLNIARMILERKLPCKVLTVDNGIDALEMLRAEQVSLVLLDIMMPEFDGMETLAEIRADERIKDVPVIMLTATGEKDLIQRAMVLGVRDYIKKPFLPADLITRVSIKLAEDKSESVLLLGDDEKTLQTMQDVIEENFPHETIIATSTKAAAEILREQEVTLIIAQADMKFIDGVNFLSLITSTEKLSSIPFAITTPDKLLEVIDKINAPAAEEVEETSAEEKAVEEPLKVEKVAAKVEDKIIPHEEKKKLGKIVTNFIGYELDVHI